MRLWILLLFLLFCYAPALAEEKAMIIALAWSPDGGYVAAGRMDGALTLWDAQTGAKLLDWRHPSRDLEGLVFRQGNLLSWTFSGEVTIDTLKGEPVSTTGISPTCVHQVAFSPDLDKIAFLGSEHTGLWDLASDRSLKAPEFVPERASLIRWSPDGKTLAICKGPDVVFFDPASGKRTGKLQKDAVFTVGQMVFSSRGTLLTLDKISVREWAVPSGEPIGEWTRGVRYEWPQHLLLKGKSMATGGLKQGEPRTVFWPDSAQRGAPLTCAGQPLFLLDDGRLVTLMKTAKEARIEIRDSTGQVIATHPLAIEPEFENITVRPPVLSPDGKRMALPIDDQLHFVDL